MVLQRLGGERDRLSPWDRRENQYGHHRVNCITRNLFNIGAWLCKVKINVSSETHYKRITAEACTEIAQSISRMGEGPRCSMSKLKNLITKMAMLSNQNCRSVISHYKLCYISKRVIWALSILALQHNGCGKPGWFDCVLCVLGSGEIVMWKVQKGEKEIRQKGRWGRWFELNANISVILLQCHI